MNQYIHAESLWLYAQDAVESKTPWDKWQFRVRGADHRWVDATAPILFAEAYEYRRKPCKPSTLTIRGVEFEWEPVSIEECLEGVTCYAPDLGIFGEGYIPCDDGVDHRFVAGRARQGLLCRTREQAIAFSNAITQGYFKNV